MTEASLLAKAKRLWGEVTESDLEKARKAFEGLSKEELGRALRLLGFDTEEATSGEDTTQREHNVHA